MRVHTRQLVLLKVNRGEVGVSSPCCGKRACRQHSLSQESCILAAAPGLVCLRLIALVQPTSLCTAVRLAKRVSTCLAY